jgi:hypothetical protein
MGSEVFAIVQGGTLSQTSTESIFHATPYIDPRDYSGFNNTGSADQTTLLNQAIQDAISNKYRLIIPTGVYLINGMLIANALGATAGRSSVWIEGMGTAYNGINSSYGAQTLFVSGSNNLPILSINAGYGTVIKNIGFQGTNTAPNNQNIGGSTGYPVKTMSSYVSAGYSSNTYAPYAAIVLDAFNIASAPTGGGYPGQSYNQNTGIGSSDVLMDGCAISNFVLGIGCSLSGGNQQGDNIRISSVQIGGVDTCVALCSSNTHVVVIERGTWTSCRIGSSSSGTWGGGVTNPTPPILRALQVNVCYRLFEASNSAGAMTLEDVYMETVRTLGTFGGGSSTYRSPLNIRGGSLKVGTSFGSNSVKLPPLYLESYGPTTMTGTVVSVDNATTAVPAFNFAGDAGGAPMTIDECTLPGSAVQGQPPFFSIPFNQNFASVLIKNSWVAYSGSGASGYYLTDEGLRMASFETASPSFDRVIATYYKREFGVGNTEYVYIPPSNSPGVSISVSALSLSTSGAGSLSFAFTGNYLLVGDLLMWRFLAQGISVTQETRAAFQVASVSGTTYTCNLLWDPLEYDTTYAPTSLFLLQAQWAPTQALSCTTDGTTNVITAVTPTTAVKNGDWLLGATGIPSNTRVVSGAGSGSLTLNNNTTAAGSTELWFGRIYTPTITAAF